jgi:hypothetical protein
MDLTNTSCIIEEVLEKDISCPKALKKLDEKNKRHSKNDSSVCPWRINSPEYNCCFWIYIADPKNQREHNLREISKLFESSINNVKLAETLAITRLKSFLANNPDD